MLLIKFAAFCDVIREVRSFNVVEQPTKFNTKHMFTE